MSFWKLMMDSDTHYVRKIWASKIIAWKWVVLYKYPTQPRLRHGFQYTENSSEKCLHLVGRKWHYTLNVRLYRDRATAYRNARMIHLKFEPTDPTKEDTNGK